VEKKKKGVRSKAVAPSISLREMEKHCSLVFAVDGEGRLTYAGGALRRLLGRKKDELLGRKVTGFFRGRERTNLQEAISGAVSMGGGCDIDLRLRSGYYSFCAVQEGAQMVFLGWESIATEEVLRVVRLARVVECMEESVCLTDLSHNIIYVNPAMTRMMGFSREEMEGKRAAVFFEDIPGNPRDLAKLVKNEAGGKSWRREIFGRRKDGSVFPMGLIMDVVKDESRRPIGYVGVSRDLTEQKRLQGQLAQIEKMAAVGQLASGLAHEFNNLIAIISGRAQFAMAKGTGEEKNKALEVALRMCERARNVTGNLLSFSRRVEPRKELSDAADVLENILSVVSRDIAARHIRIIRRYGKVPRLVMDRAQMQQVFLNILINAQHSMAAGGSLTISIRKEGRYVAIDFADTGEGIDAAMIERVFEPFVTTKGAIGRGRLPGYGLGLSVSYGIVKQHDGEISVKSTVGKGSTFTIKLPLSSRRRGTVRKGAGGRGKGR